MADLSLLHDVADAVATRQEVDWARCAARAAPGERRALDHLRAVARIARAAGPHAGAGDAAGRDRGESWFARRAVGLLVAVGALQSAVGLVTGVSLLPAAADGMLAALGGPTESDFEALIFLPVAEMTPWAAFFRIVPHVLYPVCGLVLVAGGRFDRRARLLGAVFVLLGAFWAQPVVRGFGVGLYPELFLPAVLWLFVREFPRVRRRTRLDDAASRMVLVATVAGGVLQAANLPPAQAALPALAVLAREVPGAYVAPAFFGPHCLLVLAALAVLVLRARGAASGERRRTGLFVAGIVVALAPHVEGVVEVAAPGAVTVAAANWISVLGSVSALAVPCLTLYAAIALRVLDVRTTVRVSLRRLLTRGGLAVLTAGPLAVLGGLIASRAERPVGEVIAEPLVQGCLVAAGAALVVLAVRERILARLDAWIAPETAEQRRVLAAAGAALATAAGPAEVGAEVERSARRGAGAPATLLVAAPAAAGHRFVAPAPSGRSSSAPDTPGRRRVAPEASAAPVAALSRASAIAHVLEETRAPLLVDPDGRGPAFDLLPPDEAAWVVGASAAVVLRVAGPGAATAGVVVVGRRTDHRRFRPVDLAFLDALASAAGLALERLRLAAGPVAEAADDPAARICRDCGRVAPADAGARCGDCGGAWEEAPVPALLAGKFEVRRRIGSGSMGTVFRARDVGLDRPVAVKTLPGTSPAGLARLKPEARAMAALAHPGIAAIHGLETWRGRPLLVVEYLPGGTLADRIARGPLAPAEAAAVARAVADALAALHAAGYRHGDVKPGNVGFAADGTAKLLDFGLAGLAGGAAQPAGGTVPYLSPEVLGGEPVGAADDVWALGVMLYEMVAGRRPFAGETVAEVVAAIRRRRLPPPPPASDPPAGGEQDARAALLAFAGELLTSASPARPATAAAFAEALRACVAGR